jgi:chromosome segregation ATPase
MEDDFQVLLSINNKLDTLPAINENIQQLSKDISNVKEEMRENQVMMFEFLEKSLNKINQSLDDTIDKLAEGATEEIIQALERVISDFNNNLTEQFGDNFKQLNESVKNMILWQENYKASIQEIESSFNQALLGLSMTDEKLNNITSNYQKIDQTHQNLNQIITTNQNQINNMEQHLKQMAVTGEKAKLMMDSVDNFSEKIKGSLSTQSEILTQLIKENRVLKEEISKQLPESLGELNQALTSLTHKFRDDYNGFLEHIAKIMELSHKI